VEASGQRCIPAVLPTRKKSASPIYLEAEWVPGSVRLLEEDTNKLLLSAIETRFIVCEVTTPLCYPGLHVLAVIARISLLAVYSVIQKPNGPVKFVVPESAKVGNS
jgi:hypothetical protein